MALISSWILCILYSSLLILFRQNLSHAFMPQFDPKSTEIVTLETCLLWVAAAEFADWTSCTLSGALQGAGKQRMGACIYGITMWTLGPLTLYLFAFKFGWGVCGIWAALAVVINVQGIIMSVWTSLLLQVLYL
jgi:Na+-driven multidrug efflux pump